MTTEQFERRKPGPKPGFVPAVNIRRQQQAQDEHVPAVVIPHRDPLQRSREIATMDHDELRAYAKQIGVRPRDIEELSIDRLRQNCMLTVASLVEAYTE